MLDRERPSWATEQSHQTGSLTWASFLSLFVSVSVSMCLWPILALSLPPSPPHSRTLDSRFAVGEQLYGVPLDPLAPSPRPGSPPSPALSSRPLVFLPPILPPSVPPSLRPSVRLSVPPFLLRRGGCLNRPGDAGVYLCHQMEKYPEDSRCLAAGPTRAAAPELIPLPGSTRKTEDAC